MTVAVEIVDVDCLSAVWTVSGQADRWRLPLRGDPGPADLLWRHTCFELFISDHQGPGYVEANFSPAGQWALYRFSAYRRRDQHDPPFNPPEIGLEDTGCGFELTVRLSCEPFLEALPLAGRRIGVCAVLEGREKSLSYWALHHPAARPDFHHPDGFSLFLTDAANDV